MCPYGMYSDRYIDRYVSLILIGWSYIGSRSIVRTRSKTLKSCIKRSSRKSSWLWVSLRRALNDTPRFQSYSVCELLSAAHQWDVAFLVMLDRVRRKVASMRIVSFRTNALTDDAREYSLVVTNWGKNSGRREKSRSTRFSACLLHVSRRVT